MNKKSLSIILIVLGIAAIIYSQNVQTEHENDRGTVVEDSSKKSLPLYGGIGLLVLGGIVFATTMKNNSQNDKK